MVSFRSCICIGIHVKQLCGGPCAMLAHGACVRPHPMQSMCHIQASGLCSPAVTPPPHILIGEKFMLTSHTPGCYENDVPSGRDRHFHPELPLAADYCSPPKPLSTHWLLQRIWLKANHPGLLHCHNVAIELIHDICGVNPLLHEHKMEMMRL